MQEKTDWQLAVGAKRTQIDRIDAEIIRLLGERGRLVQEVGDLKPHVGAVRVPERERQVIERAQQLCLEHGLEAEFGQQLYLLVIEYFATREEVQVARRAKPPQDY